MASIEKLTDRELRTQLMKFGVSVGPVTATTRKVFLKKLEHLLQSTKSEDVSNKRQNLSRFSSGDESEDDAKPEARKNMPPPKKTPPVKATRRTRSAGRVTNLQQSTDTGLNTSLPVSSFLPGNGVTYSAPEKEEKYFIGFPENDVKDKRTSLFSGLSGRRSYRSDVDKSNSCIYDTGSDTDANENEAPKTNLGNIVNQNRFASRDNRFSRSMGLPAELNPLYSSTDSFKHRFLNKSVIEDSSRNDGYENSSSSDYSRRYPRTSTSTFSNRIGTSLTNLNPSHLGVSNVKESDDEEPIRGPISTSSPFTARSRSDRWRAFDAPRWGSNSIVSMGLLFVFICFFAFIFISYINVKWKDTDVTPVTDTKLPICRGSFRNPGENCIVKNDVQPMMTVFRKLHQELFDHVVTVKCDGNTKDSSLTWNELSQRLIEKNADMSVWVIEQQSDNLKVLINANPQFGIEMNFDSLDIPNPSLPFICLLRNNVIYFLWFMLRILIVGVALYLIKRGANYWMRRKEKHKKKVFKLIEAILDLLQTHCQNSGDRDTFLAVDHVHDQLIPVQERHNMAGLWDDAVRYIETKESRVRSEVQQVAGEECRVWRWIPINSSRRKMWQGQAFETQEGSVNSLSVSPTPCLKIRHMFDPDVEVGDDWMTNVKNAILEKCEGVNVYHIAVDKSSSEGCVYLKCSSPEEAGKAFRALHGSWFDSKLVTVKYLRLGRYYERFPDASRCVRPLRPSNNHKMSLQCNDAC